MLCGGGTLGVDLMQLIVAPTVAYKVTPTQSVGLAAAGLPALQGRGSAGVRQRAGLPGLHQRTGQRHQQRL
jgi:long-chain fatty acid transport protein